MAPFEVLAKINSNRLAQLEVKLNFAIGGFTVMGVGRLKLAGQPLFVAVSVTVKFPVCSKLCTGFLALEDPQSPKSQLHSSATFVKSVNGKAWKAQTVVCGTLKFATGLVP